MGAEVVEAGELSRSASVAARFRIFGLGPKLSGDFPQSSV